MSGAAILIIWLIAYHSTWLGFLLLILLFAVLWKDVLRDLHEIIEHDLVELLGEAADYLLGAVTVDGYAEGELENEHEALQVDEGSLVD